jgi:hypothetical protein
VSVRLPERTLDGVFREKRTLLKSLKEETVRDAFWRLVRKTELSVRRARRVIVRFTPDLAPRKMLYGSLMGGVAFGMLAMVSLQHFLGPGVAASQPESASSETVSGEATALPAAAPAYDKNNDVFFEYFGAESGSEYENSVREMVKGYPIEEMLPEIFKQDRIVAAFLIGISKKESNWGKRVPVLNGQDCFNYWGYRGQRRMMGSGGHTCFNSRKDAVDTVAKRLSELINSEKLNTPEKLVVWKCGFSCEGQSRESVRKWISDVDHYYSETMNAGTPEEGVGEE